MPRNSQSPPSAVERTSSLAAVGAAVCLGIADKIEPGDKLEGYGYDPDRAQILPMRLGDALDALEADSELADVLGG